MHRVRIKKDDAIKLGSLKQDEFDARRKEAEASHQPIFTAEAGVELHYMPLGSAGYYELQSEDLTLIRRLAEIHSITVYDRSGRPINFEAVPA